MAAAPPAASAPAAIPATGQAAAGLESFDEMMVQFLRRFSAPGAALAVGRAGQVVYSRGFGYADAEKQQPVQPESLFRIASISKPITSVAVLHLVDRGKLKLSDRVADVLKLPLDGQADPRWRDITVLDLLHHAGGFDSSKSGDPMFLSVRIARQFGVDPPAGPAEIIRYMIRQPLDFDPAARYAYSNFGYCLLGRVIEKISAQPYETYVRREILQPCGAAGMRLGRSLLEDRLPGEVRYYDSKGHKGKCVFAGKLDQIVPAPYGTFDAEAMDSHGGWAASAADLVRFGMAFDRTGPQALLSPQSIQTTFAPPVFRASASGPASAPARKSGFYYGCGWNVRPAGSGTFNAWHLGGLPGTSTILVRRHDGLVWAVLFNGDHAADGQWLAAHVDGLVHEAADKARW